MALIAEGGRGGALVVVSSALGIKPEIGTAAYATSKAAVRQLTKVAAKEGASKKIRVNAILPGGTETALWNGVKPFEDLVAKTGSKRGAFDAMGASMPLGFYAKAEDIAGQIAFLLSDAAANITGAELLSDSGYAL
jgi:NAD(P)-dependent dehydrogenase (short-subunit alcohol dehydrogenase family)